MPVAWDVLGDVLDGGAGRGQGRGRPSGVQALMVMGIFAFLSPPQIQTLVPLLKLYEGLSDCKHSEENDP